MLHTCCHVCERSLDADFEALQQQLKTKRVTKAYFTVTPPKNIYTAAHGSVYPATFRLSFKWERQRQPLPPLPLQTSVFLNSSPESRRSLVEPNHGSERIRQFTAESAHRWLVKNEAIRPFSPFCPCKEAVNLGTHAGENDTDDTAACCFIALWVGK